MSTLVTKPEASSSVAAPAPTGSGVRNAMLLAGVLSSLLYAITDVLGGLTYEGYSFSGQVISELAAVGAPSAPLVSSLLFVYDILALAFAIGVIGEAGRSRALRVTGGLLIGRAVLGFAGAAAPAFFAMRQRGAGQLASDLPHIIMMSTIVLLLLAAIAFGAFALGRRFRIFSMVAFLAAAGFGALMAPFSAAMATGEPTPGLGIIERVCVYSFMLWLAVFAIALQRRRPAGLRPSLGSERVHRIHTDGA